MVKISVLMATKNGEKYIKTSIESILNQSFSEFELIICNDYSTDKTEEIIQSMAQKDQRIILINNNKKPGLTTALNIGLDRCKGKYIARMDDDDICHSDRFSKEYVFLEDNPQVAIVGSNINYFDDNGIYGKSEFKSKPNNIDIWKGNIFANPTVMIRSNVVKQIEGYDESDDVIRIEDYDFWCKLYASGFVGENIDEQLLDYREDSYAFKKRNNIRRVRLVKRMLFWSNSMNIPNKYKIHIIYELSKCLIPQRIIRVYHRFKYKTE